MTEFSLDGEQETQLKDEPKNTVNNDYIPIRQNTETRTERENNPVVATRANADKKLWLNVSEMEEADVEELLETLSFYEGNTQVCFVKNGKKMLCSQKVTLNKALMAELSSFLSEDCIKIL